MPENADLLIKLVRDVEDALAAVRARSTQLGLRLLKADLEVKATIKKSLDAGGKAALIFVPIEASAKRARTSVQTFTFSIMPSGGALDLGDAESRELADAILAVAAAVKKIREASPNWVPGDITVTMDLGLETSGKLVAFVGGTRTSANAHKIKLTFTKR